VEGVTTEADSSAALRNDNKKTIAPASTPVSGYLGEDELEKRSSWRFEQNAGVLRSAQNDKFYFGYLTL
jgi:hypothetical protein